MASDWETIVNRFESTAKCVHKHSPRVLYEPGCLVIDTKGNCKCEHHNGEGLPLTQVLLEWSSRYSSK